LIHIHRDKISKVKNQEGTLNCLVSLMKEEWKHLSYGGEQMTSGKTATPPMVT